MNAQALCIDIETAPQLLRAPATPPPLMAAWEQAHFVTISSLFHRPLFLDQDAARAVARVQSHAGIWGKSRCLAWVLMPDCWHGLVVLAPGDSLESLVRRFKAISARGVDARFRVNGWLWAKGHEQREVRSEENLLPVGRHIVASPVRSGLAKSVGDYPYWDSVWLDPKRGAAWAGE